MNRKRQLLWQVPFLAALIVGTIFIVRQHHNAPWQHDSGRIFGTFYNITYQSDRNLHELILEELQHVDASLSMFNDTSTLSRVNRNETTDVSEGERFCEVFRLAEQVSKATDGAFDITVAPLVNAWGFGFKHDVEPSETVIDSIMLLVGYKKVTLNSRKQLSKQKPDVTLDCSAIAKGYGADRVARLFRRYDVTNFMVEIGGEVVLGGTNTEGHRWRIGVNKPVEEPADAAPELQTILTLTDKAIATSGNYRNFYYRDGQRYAHTIDPKTGCPVEHSLLSATVLAQSCAMADAYATSFMVMGLDKAKDLLDHHKELMAYLIYSDAEGQYAVWYSPALKSKIAE